MEFAGPATLLLPRDFVSEAAQMDLDVATVHAVRDVESGGMPFLPDGRPVILFESHAFHLATGGIYDEDHPEVSTAEWVANYGAGGAHQYDRLAEAIALDRLAALSSASWGAFQILGSNFAACGFNDVEAYVAAMCQGERQHLDAFAAFCATSHLVALLRIHAWAQFAEHYNGPGYARNGYDLKLAAAWAKWSTMTDPAGNPAPRTAPEAHYATLQLGSTGDAVRTMQQYLRENGYPDLVVDGIFGYATLEDVEDVQLQNDLVADGIVGPLTRPLVGLGD